MTFKQWVRDVFGPESRAARASRPGKPRRKARHGLAPMVELLEDRQMLTAYTVTSLANSGPGTLRQAILDSVTNHEFQEQDTIRFSRSLDGGTIKLTSFLNDSTMAGPSAFAINNSDDLVIDGETGLNHGITITRDTVAADYPDHDKAGFSVPNFRLFFVDNGAALTLKGLTLTGGVAKGGNGGSGDGSGGGGAAGMGGAIFNEGNLTIQDSTLTGNTAQGGNGAGGSDINGGGGGGGLGGDGSSGYIYFAGSPSTGINPGNTGFYGAGGNGGGPHQGHGSDDPLHPNGGNGGFGGGGGGGYGFGDISTGFIPFYGRGGAGGFGAGGGGGGSGDIGNYSGDPGGNGGFGGGGGGGGNHAYGGAGGGFGGGTGTGNNGGGGAGMGGAIFNYGSRVTITNSTLEGNNAFGGKAGNNSATVAAKGLGGGVFNFDGILEVTNSTLAENYAPDDGGGIYSVDNGAGSPEADTFLNNTIVANSYRSTDHTLVSPSDVKIARNGGAVKIAGDWNLIGTSSIAANAINTITNTLTGDPKLGPLQFNGGWTKTMALQAGSPAVDFGASTAFTFFDQRGLLRVGTRDIGAFESGALFPQTISFDALADKTYGDADFPLTADTTSGQPVSYTAAGAASVYQDVGGVWYAHITGAGSATITAHQAGDDIFAAATDVVQGFSIAKANATVVVTPYNVVYNGIAHLSNVVSILGANGETGATVGAVNLANTSHMLAGTYANDTWSFTGSANYNNIANTAITNTISLALSALPDWTIGQAYTPNVVATGRSGSFTYSKVSGSLPTGLTFHSNGTITGTPTATGTFTFTLKAVQGTIANGTRTYTVKINAAPIIGALSTTAWTRNYAGFTGTMAIARGTKDYSIVGKPTGLPPGLKAVVSGNAIAFTGVPTTAGTYDGKITIKDVTGAEVTRKLTIKINAALSFNPVKGLAYQVGKPYSQTITTAGGTGTRTVAYTLSAPLPPGLTISPASPTNGAITISGQTDVRTQVTITLTVTDSIGATTVMTYVLQAPQIIL